MGELQPFSRVAVGIELVDFQGLARAGIVAEISDIQIAERVSCEVFPVGVACVGNGFCVKKFAVQVKKVKLWFSTAIIVCPEGAGQPAFGQAGTFGNDRRKLTYFANFVVPFNFLKIIGSVIGLTGAEHCFDR